MTLRCLPSPIGGTRKQREWAVQVQERWSAANPKIIDCLNDEDLLALGRMPPWWWIEQRNARGWWVVASYRRVMMLNKKADHHRGDRHL